MNASLSVKLSKWASGSLILALKMTFNGGSMKNIMFGGFFVVVTFLLPGVALADELSSSGVMNDVLSRHHVTH